MPKIVVVEDDEHIRTLVDTMLSGEGHIVLATGEPTTAYDLVRREQPDLVLCDIAMPVMDGYAVLRALQGDPATAHCPVVFMTAHREFSERVRAFRFGVVDYITKPFSRAILLAKVQHVLEGLARRTGVVAADPAELPVATFIEEAQREARTGVLTVTGPDGQEGRVVLRAGEVVGSTIPKADQARARSAEFRELDPAREDVVAHDPPQLPGAETDLPRFEELPAAVREVLVVDDNRAFRAFLRAALQSQGFTVHEAAEGESALRLALERRPKLILTDINMAGMDGFELCRRVRSHSLIRQTPLLFLSGWDDYKHRFQGMELGADDFVSKGTPLRELFLRLRLILQRYVDLGGSRRDAGVEGQIQIIGPSGILQMCHLGRLTGTLRAQDGARRLAIDFREGEVVRAESADHQGPEAVYEFLAWDRGRFAFVPGEPGPGQRLGQTFDQLLLEGCRLQDERRAGNGAG